MQQRRYRRGVRGLSVGARPGRLALGDRRQRAGRHPRPQGVRTDPARAGRGARGQHLLGQRRIRADRAGRHGRTGHRGLPDDQGRGAVPDREPVHAPRDDRDAGAGARAVPRRVFEHRHLGVVAASTAALRPDPATPHARADAGQGGGPVRGRRRPRRVHPAGDGGRPGGGRHCGGPVLDDGPARAVRRRRAPQGGIDPFPRRPGLPGRRSRPQRRRKLRNARRNH